MRGEAKKSLRVFALELVVYAVLVSAYFFLVLHFLGDWLQALYHHDRKTYAAVALGLIVGQGIVLELLTSGLVALLGWRMDEE